MHSILVPERHPWRPRVEAHIRSIYKEAYAAQVMEFPGVLMARTTSAGDVICSAGLRTDHSGFFSEIYLDSPLECVIAKATGGPVVRGDILEIVSLAFTRIRPCLELLDDITVYGRQRGHKWCLFTGTGKLRRLLRLTGLDVIKLSPASIDKVKGAQQWGDYYATDPWVCLLKNIPCAPLELTRSKKRVWSAGTKHLPGSGLLRSA